MKRQSSIVFLYITLFMALAGNSAIAETSNSTDFLSKAKNSYINKNYYKGDFYIARHLSKPNSDINNALKVIEFKNPKPTSFISGFYSEEFFRFFFSSAAYQWGSNKARDDYIIIKANDYKNYFIFIWGKPFIETWSIIGNEKTGMTAHTIGMHDAKVQIGMLDKKGKIRNFCKDFIIKGPIQYFYIPKFIDTDKDGTKELLLRYNVTLGDGYLQTLDVFSTITENNSYCHLAHKKSYDGRNGFAYFKDGFYHVSKQTADKGEAILNSSLQTRKMFSANGKLIKTETLPNFLYTNNVQILDIKYNYK